MTQRFEPSFKNMTFKNWTFWKMWLKDWTLLKYDSKNWTLFFWIWLTETLRIDLFSSNMTHKTQRVEPFYKWLEDLNFLLEICLKELYLFQKNDSKNWFLWKISKIKTLFFDDSKNWTFFWNITHRTEPFSNMTHGIEPFFPTWLIETEPFFPTWLWQIFDSKNWTFFFSWWLKDFL